MEDGVPYKVFMFVDEGSKPEVRRFGLDKLVSGKIKPLKAKLCEVYPKLKTKNFTVAWKDEDGDEILMSTDEEVKTMLNESHEAVIKLIVRCTGAKDDNNDEVLQAPASATVGDATPAKIDHPDSTHWGITCDGCNRAVTGFRYKCVTCDDFDLCMRCENDGMHPEHCVVRVPIPFMTVPLIKASMKKSRRFLKSIAYQAHEENKRVRRERDRGVHRHASDTNANIQGKHQDSQRGASRNWVEILGKYMEEFTNLAGDITRYAEKKSEPATTETAPVAGTSAGTESKSAPTNEEISLNPWNLPQEDLEKLQHACRYMRDNAVRASMQPLTKAFNKVLEIAATVAEEATAQSPARASSPIREVSARIITREAKLQSEQETPKKQDTTNAEDVAAKTQDAPKVVQEVPKVVQESSKVVKQAATPAQEASTSNRAPLTPESAKMPSQNDNIVKITFGKPTASGKSTVDAAVATDVSGYDGQCDMSELVSAVAFTKSELSSNASSCSSEGHCFDKAEGWTVIDPCESAMKDGLDNSDSIPINLLDLPEELQERIRCHAPIYPTLNTATAVLNPKEVDVVPAAASAPPLPKTEAKPASKATQPTTSQANTKIAQAAATAQALRNQLAPHVEAAVRQMEAMGFSNESGWLTQLLDHNDGNIAAVLDLITPVGPK